MIHIDRVKLRFGYVALTSNDLHVYRVAWGWTAGSAERRLFRKLDRL